MRRRHLEIPLAALLTGCASEPPVIKDIDAHCDGPRCEYRVTTRHPTVLGWAVLRWSPEDPNMGPFRSVECWEVTEGDTSHVWLVDYSDLMTAGCRHNSGIRTDTGWDYQEKVTPEELPDVSWYGYGLGEDCLAWSFVASTPPEHLPDPDWNLRDQLEDCVTVGQTTGPSNERCRKAAASNENYPGACPTDLAEANTYGYSCSHAGSPSVAALGVLALILRRRRR
ncbi:MAG: MYXO-CTERM sorting domain-containing protein [Pseudomonadota bacterium]|nr:MYXO-CTERM sorting domain-containing protein [Pseudomonadota bacterium]